ncbi:hypothetical protein BH11PLA2_BH11PLA2_26540 [soil metagenome]
MNLRLLAMAFVMFVTSQLANAQHGDGQPPRFEFKLAFVGSPVVDFTQSASRVGIDYINGKLATGKEPVTSAPLPVRFHFKKLRGEDLNFSSKDCTVVILNAEGDIIPGIVMMPFESDAATGMPSVPKVRKFKLSDSPVIDDPQMSLLGYRDASNPDMRLKSGKYTLVCSYAGQIATLPFKVKNQ